MKKLKCIGVDDWSRPVYEDEEGQLWKDTNLGSGTLSLHRASNNEFEGEPEFSISGEFIIIEEYKESGFKFQYMMLSRLQRDCDYFLGHGNRSLNILGGDTVAEHIACMKSLWNAFPDDAKPEWLTWEQLLEYEKKMSENE